MLATKSIATSLYGNTEWGGMSRNKYSTRWNQELYLSQDTSLSVVFFVYMSTGSALSGSYIVLLVAIKPTSQFSNAWILCLVRNIKQTRAVDMRKPA